MLFHERERERAVIKRGKDRPQEAFLLFCKTNNCARQNRAEVLEVVHEWASDLVGQFLRKLNENLVNWFLA